MGPITITKHTLTHPSADHRGLPTPDLLRGAPVTNQAPFIVLQPPLASGVKHCALSHRHDSKIIIIVKKESTLVCIAVLS